MTTERDRINQLAYAEEKGREDGLAEGMEKGMEKGSRQALVETARRMVEVLGYTPSQASEVTGLPMDAFIHQ